MNMGAYLPRMICRLDYERLFTGGPIGIGGDPATTEGEKSNPFGNRCNRESRWNICRAANFIIQKRRSKEAKSNSS